MGMSVSEHLRTVAVRQSFTNTEIERERRRQTDREVDRHPDTESDRHTDRHTHRKRRRARTRRTKQEEEEGNRRATEEGYIGNIQWISMVTVTIATTRAWRGHAE